MVKKPDNYKELLQNNADYIVLNRYKNSLRKLLERYPDGVPDHIIAESLDLTEVELSKEYGEIVACLKHEMGV